MNTKSEGSATLSLFFSSKEAARRKRGARRQGLREQRLKSEVA